MARALLLTWMAALIPATFAAGQGDRNPLAVFRTCVDVDSKDITRLASGATVVRTLPEEGGYLAVFGARRTAADGDRLVSWVRHIDQLKRSRFVERAARFSEPPVLADVASLTLDDTDLRSLRDCEPANCHVKLTAAEAVTLRNAISGAGSAWKVRILDAYRRLVLDRLLRYREEGHRALGRYIDGRSPDSVDAVASALLRRSPCLNGQFPELAGYLAAYPAVKPGSLESFFYWSKEQFGARPVVSAVHVVIVKGRDPARHDAIVIGKQLFANHYINGSLNLTAVVSGGPGSPSYLVVLNRTNVDVVRGLFGGVTRLVIERRLRSELSELLPQLASRLESGLPRQEGGDR